MPSWSTLAILFGIIGAATSSSATDTGPAYKDQPVLALARDARDLAIDVPGVFSRAEAFGEVHVPPPLELQSGMSASSRQKRISRSAVDILVRRIGPLAGAEFVTSVLAAQPPEGIGAIVIESGSFRLGDVRRELEALGHDGYLEATPGGVIAHAPIFIWSGAELKILPGETLKMDNAKGAFIVNAGALTLDRATLQAIGRGTSTFRAFLLTTFGGTTTIDRSRLISLGFDASAETAGIAFTRPQLANSDRPSIVQGSLFQDVTGLSLIDVSGLNILGNRFLDSPATAIVLRATRDVRIAGNIIAGDLGSHGIKVLSSSSGVTIADNLIVGGAGNGIFVTGGSTFVAISNNIVALSALTGIAIDTAACVTVQQNAVISNGSRGVAMRMALHSSVRQNRLAGNGVAGLSVNDQDHDMPLVVVRNAFTENRAGLAGSTVGSVVLSGNDFDRQIPRLATGEFAGSVGQLLAFGAARRHGEFRISGKTIDSQSALSAFSAVDLAACAGRKG
ncbi:right-handed parallel beta-helix repeat-containing protein [Rhizobium sp. Root1220]|uniref:right-handed parallel beta-helix repeat-containing protein n=1 Tax=Rhizobium sp. Root1220 TaxID=1736432 RepID=UPI0006F3A42B|nr:right-handed parallel beta-helix repeat-containing protein [Rhizobium sp. Root1220]KQV70459.1 hypothetical protein ASC90_10200 [Rhizobium sp. Root1220]